MSEIAIPESLKDLLQQRLQEQSVHEAPTQKVVYISTKGKRFRIGDEKLPDQFHAVIATGSFEKSYYVGAYNPGESASPDCFSVAMDEPTAPDPTSPSKQSSLCGTCPLNEFGSAAMGKGKACKDARRLMLYAYGADGVDFSQVAQLKVSATSLKAWSSYVSMVRRRYGLPVSWVVTTISFVDDSDYPQLQFAFKEQLSDVAVIKSIDGSIEDLKKIALRPFRPAGDRDEPSTSAPSRARSKMSG